ncbi:MAG: hypothetical protein QNJ84_10650 [Alphaproteobacteria bacterium]|nr:hypothetical protein [Alphaproteobacteria bacterium]
MAGLLLLPIYPQISKADGQFTGADFIKWSGKDQRSFVNNSIVMAIYLISQSDRSVSECVTRWFGAERTLGFDNVRSMIERNTSRNPQIVILAMMERECGSLDFSSAR